MSDASDLLEINGLSAEDVIFPGQVLYVPGARPGDPRKDAGPVCDDLSDAPALSPAIAKPRRGDRRRQTRHGQLLPPIGMGRRPDLCSTPQPELRIRRYLHRDRRVWSRHRRVDLLEQHPGHPNPHLRLSRRYRWLPWGNYTDYGIYPEPLVPVLNANGYGGDVFYGESDPTQLMQQLAWGRPGRRLAGDVGRHRLPL